ncbi:MAG TPA: phosphotransferase [Propionibacteriaceae bacterium]
MSTGPHHPQPAANLLEVTLSEVTLSEVTDSLAALGFELRRSWPRAHDHLLLDLRATGPREGTTVAGQWFGDPERARAVAAATPGARYVGRVVLQPDGADQKLPGLALLLREPGTTLVSHRPGRRAVLRQVRGPGAVAPGRADESEPVRYAKVVPLKKHRGLEASARGAASLPLRTPRVLAVDPARGTVTTAALPGVPLHHLLAGPRAVASCTAAGAALAEVHRIPPLVDLPRHTWSDEQAVTRRWEHLAARFGVGSPPLPGSEDPAEAEPGARPGETALIHRDFHDLQVLVAEDDSVGVLDFDLMALGDPSLDLANLLAHLDLRCRQGVVADAGPLREAVLAGYAPSPRVLSRVAGYEALARRRLAAVYGFRPTDHVT